jgi:UDP-glucose 4-epimerase
VGNKVLITGGAGYIGSHLVKNLLKSGYPVVVLDNLSGGFMEPLEILKKNFPLEFIRGDLSDKEVLKKVFTENKIDAVMHLAAKIDAAESVKKPALYHQENFLNSINLVETMSEAGVNKLIFSSTAAVYGNPKYTPIDENHPVNPNSPYGQTKLDFEKYLNQIENLQCIILRYFNVGGSDPEGMLGKSHIKSEDLFENIMKVCLHQKKFFEIYGKDYPTPDGTAIRDFIHVEDIAEAHILAMKNLDKFSGEIFNLGSESGFSVKEIIDKASLVIGQEIPTEMLKRRPGDIAASIASAKKAKELLGWNPQYSDLDSIIRTDWNWRKVHPFGYNRTNVEI